MQKHKSIRFLRKRLLAFGLAAAMTIGGIMPSIPSYASYSSFFEDSEDYDDGFFDDGNDQIVDDTVDQDGEFVDDTDQTGTGGSGSFLGEDSIDDTQDNDDGIVFDETGDGFKDDNSGSFGQDEIDLIDDSDEYGSEEVYLEGSADGITVTISGTREALNGAENLSVRGVSQSKIKNYEEALNESCDDGSETEVLTVLDITLLDHEGMEVEPNSSVVVTFSGTKIMENSADSRTLTAMHVVEDTGVLGLKATEDSFEDLETQVDSETLTFQTDSFSEYALVLTGYDSQKEIDFTGDQYLEIDKYLSNPTGTMNGQNTYDIYLEQAYYDGTHPHMIENLCPPGQDIILVLDQSASMAGGGRIDSANTAVEAFLQQIKVLNTVRLQNAENGVYSDIDPNGDVEAQMQDRYMRITGIIGYNNKVYEKYHNPAGRNVLTDLDVGDMVRAAHINNDYAEWVDDQDGDYDLQDMTRTDLGLDRARSWINQSNYENTYIILLTDGAPYGYGPEGSINYTYESSEYTAMSAQNANDALRTAREMKDNGATIYSVYFGYGNVEDLSAAFSTGDIHRVPLPGVHITSVFLSLISSDYRKNGTMPYNGIEQSGHVKYPFTYGFTYEETSQDRFGKYIYLPQDINQIIQDISSLSGRIDSEGSLNKRGYAGSTSYVHDEVSDPFEVTDSTGIQVYQVPRIPVNLGPDGVPTDMDENGVVTAFRWGEQYVDDGDGGESTEWIEITNDPGIAVSVKNNIVEVTGYDYELNAVTDYDKDLYSQWQGDNPRAYEPGDYGYKLVVVIPVNAKLTFGGNSIETNNSDTSAFYPSDPVGYDDPSDEEYLPPWKENTDLNPGGQDYLEKYPVPYVDFNINYKIASDNMVIYAPQTAKLENLVTDENFSLFYNDPSYSSLKMIRDDAYEVYIAATQKYNDAMTESAQDPSNAALIKAVAEALDEYNTAKDAYDNAQAAFDQVESYIPDGINNAYVDISYELKDPDGTVVGTMQIPHGTPYIVTDGVGNLKWTFTGGDDAEITKSGTYTIDCTVTPVDTVRAPGGHVATAADTEEVQESVGYISTQYSSTGSTAAGSKTAETITEEPTAYIFQLQVTGVDTRLQKGQALDFNQGNETLTNMQNVHIGDYKWVCTDGVTQSNPEDEPGVTSLLKVGSGVTVTSQIPHQAVDEELVADVMGTTVVNVDDGGYVPVSVILSRTVGDLNKSTPAEDQMKQTQHAMRTDDNLYDGYSSVVWVHECDVVDDCETGDFADAQKYNTPEDGNGRGSVRYLIHVMDNPVPDISKETDTPGISRGEDIEWTIQLDNDNQVKNPKQRTTVSTMVDVLPFVGDGRIDPATNIEGSQFNGSLQYKSIVVDYSGSATALQVFTSGGDRLYYTTDTAVQTADEAQMLGMADSGNISWNELPGTLTGDTVAFSGCPENATAIRLDTTIAWGENVTVNLSANLTDLTVQAAGDHYHNQAEIMNGNGITTSEVVATTVTNLYISGTVWEDMDFNGLMGTSEPKVQDVVVTLYQPYNPANGGTPDRTVNGIQLSRAYNTNGDKFGPVLTLDDGTFLFDDIQAGTYYVVVDRVPDKYDVTRKQAGAEDTNSSRIDSEAEEEILPANTADEQRDAKSVWIRDITVTDAGVPNENIGLKNILGSITVGKTLDEIYYPSSMTDEERADYTVSFLFKLRNTATNEVFTRTMTLDADTISRVDGQPQIWAEFSELPLGTYELTETGNAQYTIESVTSDNDGVQYDAAMGIITVPITSEKYDVEVEVDNTLKKDPPGGDQGNTANWINMRVPVSLDVTYVGADPISDQSAVSYTFNQEDFAPRKLGDVVVTYDDGSTISLSAGTLSFDQLTLSPATVYNTMNSGNDKIPVTVYYTEKGRTVSDSFRVGVDLKPIHKFQINFDSNGGTFSDGSSRNSVMFGYDESTQSNFITTGVYKDVANGGLNSRGSDYTFAGWNTRPDGSGIQYDSYTSLNAVGMDTGVSTLTLYANWKTNVTFDANGGTLAGGMSDAERALVGRTSGTISYNVNQSVATGLYGVRTNFIYVLWNTKPDGTGIAIEDYGPVTGPVTFYAVYYQSIYNYTGSYQVFTAPITGTYSMTLYGAEGGTYGLQSDTYNVSWNGIALTTVGGKGGSASGTIHLNAGTTLYVYVGQRGGNRYAASNATGAFNGGGSTTAAGGGGATDIRTRAGDYSSRIIVAGGGGGASKWGNGGAGGTTAGERGFFIEHNNSNSPTGITYTGEANQVSGAGFGYGGSTSVRGGSGGGGWYGGYAGRGDGAGGGGSSYIAGYSACNGTQTSAAGFTFTNALMQRGVRSGDGYAQIVLVSAD